MFILGERLTEYFKEFEGCEDIVFGNFGEEEKLETSLIPISNKTFIKEDDIRYLPKLTFGSFDSDDETYKPSFGIDFKCGLENIEKIGRIQLANLLLLNKMLFLNKNINTHIFDNKEKKIIRELKKILNRNFSCSEEYELIVSVLLNDKTSLLNRFLISNEKMLFEYYEKDYDNAFKNLPIEYVEIEKEKLQYIIRQKTTKAPYYMINPLHKKHYNFRKKELELYDIFLNNQRSIKFKDENEYFEWLGSCQEFLLLQDWNYAWFLHRNIEMQKSKNTKNMEEFEKELEEINFKLGRNNEDYLFV